ncbi:MAG: hypothetical protein ABL892_05600 [Thiobacillaceae bacterium]
MKKLNRIMAILMTLSSPTYAADLSPASMLSAYLNIPFGTNQTSRRQALFGLRVDQVWSGREGAISLLSDPMRPPLVDFRFKSGGVDGIYVNGVNTVTPSILRAAEGDSSVWVILGSSAVAAVALALSAGKNVTPPPAQAQAPQSPPVEVD